MESFFTGSVQSWLAVVVATLSPLIALIVGFEGADWLLRRRQLGRTGAHPPLKGAEGATDGRGTASLGRPLNPMISTQTDPVKQQVAAH